MTASGTHPLTHVQEGLLFHCRYQPASDAYLTQWWCTLEHLDPAAFRRAWALVVRHQASLRTRFGWDRSGQPVQVVEPEAAPAWESMDWRALPPETQRTRWDELIRSDRIISFVPTVAPPLRFTLVRCGDRSWRFLWSFHQLILDHRSRALVLRDVFDAYRQLRRGGNPVLAARPSHRAQAARLAAPNVAGTEAFWRDRLRGYRQTTSLGPDGRFGGPDAKLGVWWRQASLSPVESARLRACASKLGVEVETLVQGAWAVLLSRFDGRPDVCFGVTVPGSHLGLPAAAHAVGSLVVTLPLRVTVTPAAPVAAWLAELHSELGQVLVRGNAPLVHIRGLCDLPHGQPLFETLLVCDDVGEERPNDRDADATGLCVHHTGWWDRTDLPFCLDLLQGSKLTLAASFDDARFHPAAVDRVLGHLRTLLCAMAASPGCPLQELPVLAPAEQERILLDGNRTEVPVPDLCLHELVERQVDLRPDAVAVDDGAERLTYQELDRRANQLAHDLQARGAAPDTVVAVHLERSALLVVALIGVLKAGAAYLPLDPEAPPARHRRILDDARALICLTDSDLAHRLPTGGPESIRLDEAWVGIAQRPKHRPTAGTRPGNLVSVYYTSGSSGTPKGVANTHTGWVNRMVWMQRQHRLAPGERVLHKTTLTFDDASVEVFWPLTAGGCAALLGPGLHRDPEAIKRAAIDHQAVALQFVPSWLGVFLDHLSPDDLRRLGRLRHVISSGEALRPEIVARFLQTLGRTGSCRLHNQWGTTEVSIDSTIHTCTTSDAQGRLPVAIGTPIDNNAVHVLDHRLQPVPVGVTGELYLAGIGLARGYLHDPARTAEAFVPNPFVPGAVMYRTGDRGYRRADGAIVFLGRRDAQVKLRGIRIELGEVEQALAQHPDVSGVVVTVCPDQLAEPRLVAYVVARRPVSSQALRVYLRGQLPSYMLPAQFILLDALPRMPSGKVDRNALPAPTQVEPEETVLVGPRDDVERALVDIWSEVLGVSRVGVHHDFFALGGHSLLAVRVAARIRAAFEVDVPIQVLFDTPTVAQIARFVERAVTEAVARLSDEEALRLLDGGGERDHSS